MHSSRSLYSRPFCKLISTLPPVYDLRWLETKWYPVVFMNSALQSINQVSDTPVTEKGMLRFHSNELRGCPREHRAVVLHAISLISMKLCQLIGGTPKLKKTNWFLFGFFPGGGDRPPPVFYLVFTREIALNKIKCMKLSRRWYLANYSEGLRT